MKARKPSQQDWGTSGEKGAELPYTERQNQHGWGLGTALEPEGSPA